MSPRIYRSPVPDVAVHHRSIFTHLCYSTPGKPELVGGYPHTIPAFVDAPSGTTITRGQLKHLALSFAFGLRDHPVVAARSGEVVLVYSENSLSWPVALFGSVAAGLKCTLANSAYVASELAFQYTNSGARLVFTSETGLPNVRAMFKLLGISPGEGEKRIIVLSPGLEWAGGPPAQSTPESSGVLRLADLLTRGTLTEEEDFNRQKAHETAFLCYSSGTTGKPKGVETTHQNVTTVLDMVKTLFPTAEGQTEVLMGVLPFYHIYGAIKLLQFPFLCGNTVVIQARFEPSQFCAIIEKYKVGIAFIVPPILVVLARHPAIDKYDLSSLRLLFSGAAPLGAALSKQVIERLSAKRPGPPIVILQGYGLTETSPTTHLVPVSHSLEKLGSAGVLLPNLEARLVVDHDGKAVEALEGQAGEVWLRGPTIMKGYLGNSKATRDSITPDGWFKTGDIAIRDNEGFFYIVDRQKELIKYKGFQVPPAELESVLLGNPEVGDAAVIGVESKREATELPRAYVVPVATLPLKTPQDKAAFAKRIQTYVQERVAKHKHLRGGVALIEAVPKSAAGKILRRELRELAKKEFAGRDPSDGEILAKL